MTGDKEVLYVKLAQNIEVSSRDVCLADVAAFACTSAEALNHIKTVKLLKVPAVKKYRKTFSILEVIQKVNELYPKMEIQNMGETDFIVTYVPEGKGHPVLDRVKTILIGVTIFFGSAFSIMAFNNDIDVSKLFGQIYEQLTGQPSSGFTVLEIAYCIGLAVGIIVFFNHFLGKQITMDPTPIEVQMKVYEQEVNQALIDESSRKGKGMKKRGAGAAGGDRS